MAKILTFYAQNAILVILMSSNLRAPVLLNLINSLQKRQ